MKSPKEFLVRSGIHPSLGERESDYTIVVDGYRRKVGDSSRQRLIKYRKETIERLYGGSPPERIRDLLEVALATHAADRLVTRGPTENTTDDERMLSSRQIRIVCPVSDIDLWRGLESELSHAMSFISRDNFQYRFVEPHNPISPEVQQREVESDKEVDCIALFSGGLDSLGGAHYLSKNGYSPKFVSVNHGRNVGHLVDYFSDAFEENLVCIDVDPDFRGYESTQFTRSFLYLAFATAVSVALDVSDIFLPENGILARFPMLQHGWTTTRTVHPTFVRSYNQILDSLYPERGLSVKNPFLNWTKTEVVNQIPDTDQVLYTRTCPHPRGLSMERDDEGHPMNCGLCIPCLVRVIALTTSDHQIPISEMLLDSNPFLELDFGLVEEEGLQNLSSDYGQSGLAGSYKQTSIPAFLLGLNQMLSFASQVHRESQQQLASDYIEVLDDEVYTLYSQFSHEVFEFVDRVSEANPSLKRYVEEYLSVSAHGDSLLDEI